MTVETESGGEPILKSGPYNGNGVTSVFDYDFRILANTELEVLRKNADNTVTTLVLTTDYTVAGVGDDSGGQITLLDPANDLPTGTQLLIRYDGDFLQTVDWSNQSAIQLSQLEDAVDKLTMHTRQLYEILGRALVQSDFGSADTQLGAASALGYLRWNAAADAIEAVSAVTGSALTLPGTVGDGEFPVWSGTDGLTFQRSGVYFSDGGVGDVRVGIGGVPQTLLHVIDDAPQLRLSDNDLTDNEAHFIHDGLETTIRCDPNNVIANSRFTIHMDGAEALRFTSAGNLGIGNVPTYALDLGAKTGAMRTPVGTTAQRPATANGVVRMNTTIGMFEAYHASAWQGLLSTQDHASLATGDILYVDASGDIRRLAAGTTGQVLTMGASVPEWATP